MCIDTGGKVFLWCHCLSSRPKPFQPEQGPGLKQPTQAISTPGPNAPGFCPLRHLLFILQTLLFRNGRCLVRRWCQPTMKVSFSGPMTSWGKNHQGCFRWDQTQSNNHCDCDDLSILEIIFMCFLQLSKGFLFACFLGTRISFLHTLRAGPNVLEASGWHKHRGFIHVCFIRLWIKSRVWITGSKNDGLDNISKFQIYG